MKPTMYLDIPTIGVTGSFGKTTVKEITASILATKYNTYKSPKTSICLIKQENMWRILPISMRLLLLRWQ